MLEELHIQGLGVIADAQLRLAPGLTVLTGETGAGKTMVLQGLGLVTGGRADAGLVRTGAERAVVEARLRPSPAVADRVDEAGGELDDDGSLVLRRSLSPEGRSRAHVGGATVPAGVLQDVTRELIAVHGQHDQLRLLRPREQRAALDRFAGEDFDRDLGGYRALWTRWRDAVAALAQAEALERTRAEETERLRYGLERVDAVAPAAGEDRALAVEIERLDHAEQLREAAAHALARLSADVSTGEDATSAGALLADAHRELGVAASHDPVLADLDGRLDEIGYLVADLASELAGYVEAIDTDPARLAALQERRAALGALVRLHGPDLDGVLAWAAAARGRLGELEGNEDRLAALAEEATALRGKLEELAAVVTDGRMLAAERFGATVSVELAALAMPSAHVTAEVRPTPELGPDGRDEVELLLRPHPGAQSRPLARGASGGELSRVMLAVEVVFARADDTATLIFDEVDAGVGGKAAVEVGRRLARLARDHQVVVVTHLPQVAAFADRHLLVEKSDDGSVTETGVVHLEGPARVAELSRMLAGLDASERALAHAEELLAVAEEAKRA